VVLAIARFSDTQPNRHQCTTLYTCFCEWCHVFSISYNAGNRPELKTAHMFRPVFQVAAAGQCLPSPTACCCKLTNKSRCSAYWECVVIWPPRECSTLMCLSFLFSVLEFFAANWEKTGQVISRTMCAVMPRTMILLEVGLWRFWNQNRNRGFNAKPNGNRNLQILQTN